MIPFVKPPWKHQEKAVSLALATRDFAFLMEMGVGKSKATVDTLRNRYSEHKRVLRTFILSPVAVCENWRREFIENSNIGYLVVVLEGSEKNRLKVFLEKRETKQPHIFISNYECLQMKQLFKALVEWQIEVLVCDESQRLKNHSAVRSRFTAQLSKTTLHNYILSGTPILNTPLDIFSQWRVLDRGQDFGDNFFQFRARYFYDKNAGMPVDRHFPKWEIRKDMIPFFNNLIGKKSMRVLKKDCLDLPDLVRVEVGVELTKEQRRIYDEMKRDFIAFLDSGTAVTAQVALVKVLRLQQIATGFVKTEAGDVVAFKENPRLKALAELIDDIPDTEKIIVWCSFQENYRQVANLLTQSKIKFTELHGGVAGKDRQKNIDIFQGENDTRIMIANQSAGGVGVNLTRASCSIFYSRTFSLEQDLQAEARNHRGGSEIHQKITRYDLIARNSIDEIIAESLQSKFNLAEKILELRDKL